MVTAKKSVGEKWVLYVGKNSVGKYSLGRYAPLICILLAIILGVIFYFSKHLFHLAFAVVALCSAFILFERRNFYQIIERQNKHIADLERKADEA